MSERSSGQLVNTVHRRLSRTWNELQSSLWFLPTVIIVGLALLAVGVVAIDRALWQNGTTGLTPGWFRGGVDGARGVLTAISGSLVTAAATVFSITVVVLQLASNQFTPRVVRNFTSDRNFQVTLGLLLGTFVYSLLALWSVGQEREDREPFIPTLAVGIGIVLALISVAALILFIRRVSDLIQVSLLVDRLADETIGQIKLQYGDEGTDADSEHPEIDLPSSVSVRSPGAGYIRSIDHGALLAKADERSCTIAVSCQIGDFVLIESELAQVRVAEDALDEDFVRAVQRAFERGPYRLFESDIELAIQRITDIAVKALSPGINDPTTALNCIERLCEVLQQIAIRDAPARMYHGEDGGVVLARGTPTFAELVHQMLGQIRHYGAGDVVVSSQLATKLGELAAVVPTRMGQPLAEEAALILLSCEAAGMIPGDLVRVERSASWAETANISRTT